MLIIKGIAGVRATLAATIIVATGACGGGSDGITVAAKVASLRFVSQPTNVKVGETFSVQVELLSSTGARVPTAADVVTLAVSGTGASLTGTTSVAAIAGLASFSGLGVSAASASLQLTASAAGKTVTSAAFAASDPCAATGLTFPGSVSGTLGSTSCTINTNATAVYRFQTNGQAGVQFNVTSSFAVPAVEVTSDPPGNNVVWRSVTNGTVTAEWLLPSGTYLVRAGARNGGTGSFTLTGSTSPLNNPACNDRTLVVGLTLTNQALANTDCPHSSGDGTFFDSYIIYSTKQCTITMSSATMDSFIEVVDAVNTNVFIDNDDDSGGGLNSTLTLPSCSSGSNPIEIRANTTPFPPLTGNYNLSVTITGGGSLRATDARAPLKVSKKTARK